MRDAGKFGVLGTLVKGSAGPSTLVAGPQGGIRKKKKKGPGLILIWVISGEFLDLPEPQFLHQSNGNN